MAFELTYGRSSSVLVGASSVTDVPEGSDHIPQGQIPPPPLPAHDLPPSFQPRVRALGRPVLKVNRHGLRKRVLTSA